MKLSFDEIEEKTISGFKGGSGDFVSRMYVDENCKIMRAGLAPGASIGLHTHDTSSEIIYILKGEGRCLYDDGEERLAAGDCHYCPKGHMHSLINDGAEELTFFAVVPEQ
ncbi:MAG: cupin domain-containing protein [Muribaculaceae bacterium]|nr:cupin domain-containing protein [Roseburia sp.]MCM1429888.1 cupin domain-containing protein [Muribaculaceae bacterium]MCM1493844.1 cupin domain-containing protein [Muribaculaceae bacterium]